MAKIHDHWTAARQAWLEQLAQGPAQRPHNPVGYQCMQLGWTDWERDAAGYIGHDEVLTEAGRQKLAGWRGEHPR